MAKFEGKLIIFWRNREPYTILRIFVLGHLAIALPFYFHIFQQQKKLHSQLLSAASLSLADSYAQHILLDHIELNLLSFRIFSINLSLYFT